jgi:NADH:ubiquinone oxidoreductase subunit C
MVYLENNLQKVNYYILFFLILMKNYLYGILIKTNIIYLFLKLSKFYLSLNFLKKNIISNFNSLVDINVVDYIFCNNLRFELTYIFWNIIFEIRLGIKFLITGLLPIYSIGYFFKSSNWLEREIWDMFGIKFFFHKNMRRILTDYGFKGYPLRKDFPLIGFYDLFYDDFIKSLKLLPVEVSQSLRFYKCSNPWAI